MTEVVQPKTGDTPETVIVDIFRVEDGKTAEQGRDAADAGQSGEQATHVLIQAPQPPV